MHCADIFFSCKLNQKYQIKSVYQLKENAIAEKFTWIYYLKDRELIKQNKSQIIKTQ